MDSLKIPKGNGSKSPGSVPLAIRFNAGDESVEDVLRPSDSLSSSPQQTSEDFSWRKDFLHGGFFNRKRSGSIEGISSPSSGIISNLSSSDTNTVGTWKLIKGKVSQAMEDIKSSKTSQASKVETIDDGDFDNVTVSSSISDDLSLDLPSDPKITGIHKTNSARNLSDSDSDIDPEIFMNIGTVRPKSASSARTNKPTIANKDKKEEIPKIALATGSSSSSSGIRSTFLRKRKKFIESSHGDKKLDEAIVIPKAKIDIEIESGVEVIEGMLLPSAAGIGENFASFASDGNVSSLGASSMPENYAQDASDRYPVVVKGCSNRDGDDNSPTSSLPNPVDLMKADIIQPSLQSSLSSTKQKNTDSKQSDWQLLAQKLYQNRSIVITSVLMIFLLLLPIPSFFCGVIVCLFTISLFSFITDHFVQFMERNDSRHGPEKSKFKIPDYSNMPICEIPAVEEHKPLKSYSGWMNEINNYDPANYHISMTRSVYVRLDGSILRLSSTSTRVSKRTMWNEQPIDRNNITFTDTRTFNLLGCRIEMCPRGLARKRHFSRKYPIQLIIKNLDSSKLDENNLLEENQRTSNSEKFELISTVDSTQQLVQSQSSQGHPSVVTNTNDGGNGITHQSSNESCEDRHDFQNDMDFGATILNSDLQKLQDSEDGSIKENVPCGDERRLLLFARCDREKEDWYRRFYSASIGTVNDQELKRYDFVVISEEEINNKITCTEIEEINNTITGTTTSDDKSSSAAIENNSKQSSLEKNDSKSSDDSTFEGLLMSPCAARNPISYIKFMSKYQKACTLYSFPGSKSSPSPTDIPKRNRRQKKQEDELWKGIDQSLYLGPSGSVVWANVLIGRILYSCLNDSVLLEKIQEFLQKKLSAIRLPSFMEDVVIAQVYLGDTPPLIHRVSQPLLNERGTWIDADVTYEGLMHMTITTKLNLLRLKRQQQTQSSSGTSATASGLASSTTNVSSNTNLSSISTTAPSGSTGNLTGTQTDGGKFSTTVSGNSKSITPPVANGAIYDSNAESSGESSSDSESPTLTAVDASSESQSFYGTPGGSRRLLRIVDRITASNLFQSATEISYIQRAMENMSTKITLRVELKGFVSRVVINFPPPPSDRIWIAFRGPPRLWISAKPAVGDHTFDWSIVTNVIENKLCDEVYKYLVYPNMVDIIAPFLGQSTYKE